MHTRLAKIAVLTITLLIASPTLAYYGHSYGHRGFGHSFGHHGFGHSYGRHSYGHSYRYGGSHGYPYYGYRRYGYGGGYYPYSRGLAYGLLSIPGRVITGLFGGPYNERSYADKPEVTPAVAPRTDGGAANQSSQHAQAGAGWALLSDGHYARALSVFGREAQSNPTAGKPKVGYALATAAGGDLGRGVWAMRRAARIDPQSMEYVDLDPRLAAELDRLTLQYQANLERDQHDQESAFMVASLRYLAGDLETARSALEKAVEYGDDHASTQNLARLIEQGSTSGTSPDLGAGPAVAQSGSSAGADDY